MTHPLYRRLTQHGRTAMNGTFRSESLAKVAALGRVTSMLQAMLLIGRALLLQAAIGLLTTLLAYPSPALAQGPIHSRTTDFTHYLVKGDGSTAPASFPAPASATYSTTWGDYPGHLYLHFRDDGMIPGTATPYGNFMVWSNAIGQSK